MLRRVLPGVALLTALAFQAPSVPGQEEKAGKAEMVANPFYTHWAGFKVGSTATQREKVKYHEGDPEGKFHPGGVVKRDVFYKLLEVTPEKVVVQTVVVDYELLSVIQSAPTRIAYPAKIKKADLEAAKESLGAKPGKGEVKVGGKTYKCKVMEWTTKSGEETTAHKVWYTADVPGGIVKRTNVTRRDDKVISEGSIALRNYKAAQ
jgi:hypothetical protein